VVVAVGRPFAGAHQPFCPPVPQHRPNPARLVTSIGSGRAGRWPKRTAPGGLTIHPCATALHMLVSHRGGQSTYRLPSRAMRSNPNT
jgi:hypothetical protein